MNIENEQHKWFFWHRTVGTSSLTRKSNAFFHQHGSTEYLKLHLLEIKKRFIITKIRISLATGTGLGMEVLIFIFQ